ncbi:5-oxoprolinase subunit B family protein [Yoonia sp. 2307UL14-13]|uniref:5-oxoprolinase subunit B family protein n=1 Tax=Yoonia sp. 2307UL14-13 TaxID=3126506 RepID=UPI00309BF940
MAFKNRTDDRPMTASHFPEYCPLGVDGVLVRFARVLNDEANVKALAFRDAVRSAGLKGVIEVATSLTSVRVAFDPDVTDRVTVTAALREVVPQIDVAAAKPRGRHWTIPVSFAPEHAPQLTEAAALAGLTADQAIDQITAAELRVIAIGFAPGQAYMGMLPAQWELPRQDSLTESLPRGALITAVRQLIIWAADAPTGWRHIGQTAFEVYRPDAAKPFAFAPGDTVTFEIASGDEIDALRAEGDPDGGARCRDGSS